MENEEDRKQKKTEKTPSHARWVIRVFLIAVALSASMSLCSGAVLEDAGYVTATLILLLFIALGILFDIIGVAVTAANPKPFNSMAAHRVKGAKEALYLIRNAEKVASFCNDVVGDTLMLFDSSIEPGALHQLSRESLISDPADDGPGKILIVPYTIRFLGPRLQGGKRRQ